MGCDSREHTIREIAYSKWEQSGCPSGDGVNFWLEAEKELCAQEQCESKPATASRGRSIKASLVAVDPPPLKMAKTPSTSRKRAS